MGRRRSVIQLLWTALSNGYFCGFVTGRIYTGKTKALCLPGLNCYSCPGALGSCPIGSLQAVLNSRNYKFSFYVLGFLMLFGSILGRFICGWLCPFGMIQDFVYKIPFFKKRKNLPAHKVLIWLKYVILAVFVFLMPSVIVNLAGMGEPWFCEYICPSGTLFGAIPLIAANEGLRSAVGGKFALKAVTLVVILLAAAAYYRPFCKYLCPLGAFYGCFNAISVYRLSVDQQTCISCGKCRQACGMDIAVWKKPNSSECIRCGECFGSCPTGAIRSSMENNKFKECFILFKLAVSNRQK